MCDRSVTLFWRRLGAQVPHIAEGTVRENIIFGAPFDEVCLCHQHGPLEFQIPAKIYRKNMEKLQQKYWNSNQTGRQLPLSKLGEGRGRSNPLPGTLLESRFRIRIGERPQTVARWGHAPFRKCVLEEINIIMI